MKKNLLIMLLLIGMIGFTPIENELPTPTSKEFTWNSQKIEFNYIGSGILTKDLLKSIVISTMEVGKNECNEFKPTILTINGEINNLVSVLEFNTSKECSMTESLQLLIIFDVNGNIKSKFTTFN